MLALPPRDLVPCPDTHVNLHERLTLVMTHQQAPQDSQGQEQLGNPIIT